MVPVVALRGRGQAGQDSVAVLLTADEHLTAGVGILGVRKRERETNKTVSKLSDQSALKERHTRAQVSSYQRVFEVHESPVIHGEPPLLEALCVLWQSRKTQEVSTKY